MNFQFTIVKGYIQELVGKTTEERNLLMQKIITFVLAFILFAVIGPVDMFAQETKSNDDFAKILKSENKDISEETVAEILAIRKRLGSGLGLEVADSFKLPETKSLSTLVESDSPSGKIFLNAMKSWKAKSTQPAGVFVGKLRMVARKMDQLAADLEDLDLFEDADQIRNQAAKIRLRARKHKSGVVRR